MPNLNIYLFDLNPSISHPIYMTGANLVMSVPAHDLASNGARPAEDTVLTWALIQYKDVISPV